MSFWSLPLERGVTFCNGKPSIKAYLGALTTRYKEETAEGRISVISIFPKEWLGDLILTGTLL